jgi:16S rRNA (guanine(966)-N(2))-methyltransferase RsmD
MRIISGLHKGRRLKAKSNGRIRPTSDRVRSAIFNILPPDLSEAAVLDLYAGTGALGIEALSRGAWSAVFVDVSREAVASIRSNLKEMALEERTRIVNQRALAALRLLAGEGRTFDLVFADPPYQSDEAGRVLKLIAATPLLSPEAVVVIEHDPAVKLELAYGPLARTDYREYGGTAVSFYERRPK